MSTLDEWLADEPADEPQDLLAIPEIRQHVCHDHRDEDLGLWALLERAEVPSAFRAA